MIQECPIKISGDLVLSPDIATVYTVSLWFLNHSMPQLSPLNMRDST